MKRRMLRLSVVIIALISCASPIAPVWAGAAEGAPGSSGVRISDLEAVRFADTLLAQGRLGEAETVYLMLLESPKMEFRVEALFKLGNIYAKKKEYGKAIELYLSILENYPGLSRVRLELARVYFWDKDFAKADFNFRLVQGDSSVPPEVQEKIDTFLDAIRRHKNWTLTGTFSIVPDSNLNSSSGAERECIRTVYGMLCRDLEQEESGVGIRLGLSGNHYLRLYRHIGVKSTAGVSILDFPQSRFDDNSVFLASGPRFIYKKGETSLQPTFSKRWAGGKEYSESYGVRLDSSYDLARRLSLEAGLRYAQNRYDDPFVNSLLKGGLFDAYLGGRYILNNKSFVSAGLDYQRDNTRHRSYSSESWGCNMGYFSELPLGVTAYAGLSWLRTNYKASRWFIGSEGYIEDLVRRDDTFQSYLRLSNRRWEYKGFTPAVSHTYTHRRSNAWNYGYDRHRLELSVRQIF